VHKTSLIGQYTVVKSYTLIFSIEHVDAAVVFQEYTDMGSHPTEVATLPDHSF